MNQQSFSRRGFLSAAAATTAALSLPGAPAAEANSSSSPVIRPPEGKSILISCKLGMIAKEANGKKLSLVERLRMAAEAGFDGVEADG